MIDKIPMSEEHKRKISESHKGIPCSEMTKKKISATLTGYKCSEERKKNISKSLRGRIFTEEHKRRLSEAQKNIPMEKCSRWEGGLNTDINGYIQFKSPNGCRFSSMKNKRGYIKLHRLIMAEYLQRSLKDEEVVHHINGDITDNRIENLKLLENKSEHARLHHKLRIQEKGGMPMKHFNGRCYW